MPRVSHDLYQLIHELLLGGYTPQEIAPSDLIPVSTRSVNSIASSEGLARGVGRPAGSHSGPLCPDLIAAIHRRRADGETYQAIADQLGLRSKQAVFALEQRDLRR